MKVLVTGCAGFIGLNLIKYLLKNNYYVIGIDSLTYASNKAELKKIKNNKKFIFYRLDINSKKLLNILKINKPNWIVNLAAESHVDNSIINPEKFIRSNINGLFNLLLLSTDYYSKLNKIEKKKFKFLQISTDEVYGSLIKGSAKEISKYNPSSPYSASKASSDMLINSWIKTYKFPAVISYSCNNFGPHQNKEKFIPKIILSLKENIKIPVYGNGLNQREWIFVNDHILAIERILLKGRIGEKYNIGSRNNLSNIQIVIKILNIMKNNGYINSKILSKNIKYIKDRAGHDFRYSLNSQKIKKELSWREKFKFEKSLKTTIDFYFNNLND